MKRFLLIFAATLFLFLTSCEVYTPIVYPNIVYRTNDIIIDTQRCYSGYEAYSHYTQRDLENIARRNHYWQYYPPHVVIERPIIIDQYRQQYYRPRQPQYRHR